MDVVTGSEGAIFRFSAASTNLQIIPEAANGNVAIRMRANSGAAPNFQLRNDAGSNLVTITNGGSVGIGTTSVGHKLDLLVGGGADGVNVYNNATGAAYYQLATTSRSYKIEAIGSDLRFYDNTGSAERARIDSSGRLLVGASTSYANADVDELQIGNNSSATKTGITLGSTDQSGIAFADASNARAGLIEYTHSIDSLRFYTNGTNERFRISSTGAQSSVIPGGSTLYPSFDCRAWVNFNGSGTVAIRASGNVSSITDNGTGDYTVNFTTAMADANYSLVGSSSNGGQGTIDEYTGISAYGTNSYLAGSVRIGCVRWRYDFQAMYDAPIVSVAIFR